MELNKSAQRSMNAHKRLRDFHHKRANSNHPKAWESRAKYSYHYDCMRFIYDHKRKPTKTEKKQLFAYAKNR